MRRTTDKLVAVCAVLCILCTAVTVVVAVTVVDTKSRVDSTVARTSDLARLATQVKDLALRNQQLALDTRALTLQTRHDAEATNSALCALRGNLERRVTGSEDYLKKHPEGIPGIASAGEIRRDIRNQRQTISTLSGLDC